MLPREQQRHRNLVFAARDRKHTERPVIDKWARQVGLVQGDWQRHASVTHLPPLLICKWRDIKHVGFLSNCRHSRGIECSPKGRCRLSVQSQAIHQGRLPLRVEIDHRPLKHFGRTLPQDVKVVLSGAINARLLLHDSLDDFDYSAHGGFLWLGQLSLKSSWMA